MTPPPRPFSRRTLLQGAAAGRETVSEDLNYAHVVPARTGDRVRVSALLIDEDGYAYCCRNSVGGKPGRYRNAELLTFFGRSRVSMAVGAEMVHKPCSAKEVAAVIVEPGEHLEFEQVADIAGDPDGSGGGLSIESQAFELKPVIKGTLDLENLARGRARCPESWQVRFPLGTGKAGKGCFGGGSRRGNGFGARRGSPSHENDGGEQ